jgi:uncharacterized repeat protein (TIGR03847 family)
MVRRFFDFDTPDRFVAGVVGQPGDRTFYLQARQGHAVVSLVIEKVQVAALAGRLSQLLDAVEDRAPQVADGAATRDDEPLDEPIVEVFRIGALALAWDETSGRVVIEAQPPSADGDFAELPDNATGELDLLRVRIGPERARDFVRRAAALVVAGRPSCPFCGQPLDPGGHFCPKTSLN